MNILVLTPTLLGDSQADGGLMSCKAFLQSLVPRHNLSVVAFDGKADAASIALAKAEMRAWAKHVDVVALNQFLLWKLHARLKQILLFETEAVFFGSRVFRAACEQALRDYSVDMIIVMFPQMAQYVDLFSEYPTIMDTQDVFSVSKFRRSTVGASPIRKLRHAINWLKWVRFERRYYRQFNHVLVVSEQDKYGLKLFSPELKITTLPRLMNPPTPVRLEEVPPFHIGFMGAFSHEPNVLSLQYLLDSILPPLSARFPHLQVLIAGKNPPKSLVACAAEGVHFAGYVATVDEFYSQVSVVVAPLVTGGGIKMKVIEALLSGVPVVTSSIGADGLELIDGTSAFIADDASSFVSSVARLLESPALRVSMASAGKDYAMRHCAPENHGRIIEEVFASACEVK